MKKNYQILSYQKWLVVMSWLVGLTLPLIINAQAPVIQWQRSIEPVIPGAVSGRSAIVKNSSGGYFVVTADRRLVALTTAGDVLSDTPIRGTSGSDVLSTVSPVSTNDGNVVVGVLDSQSWSLQKRNANGGVLWASNLAFSVSPQYDYSVSSIVASSDGGFVAFAIRYDRTYADPFAPDATYVIITKVNQTGYVVWQKELRYLTPGGPNNSLLYTNGTRVNKVVNTPDAGYLLVGTANPTTSNSTLRGWAAKLDGDGSVVWQRHYQQMNELNDVSADLSATEAYFLNGYALPATPGFYASSTLRIDALGNPTNTPVQVPYQSFNSLATVTAVPPSEKPLVYLVGNDTPWDNNKGDIRLTGFSDQGGVVWTKTLGGSGRDYNFKPAILSIPDGYIVAGVTESNDGDVKGRQTATPATWIVKLQNPANAFKLTAPTYTCQTGAITFNTTGGDGSPVTYSAPGITRSSPTSNAGVVEQGLRNDPKPIVITATQSGVTATYTFNLIGACTNEIKPPVLTSYIPDQTYKVGQVLDRSAFNLATYIQDPTQAQPHYMSNWSVSMKGLPAGILQSSGDLTSMLNVSIIGAPTSTGVYTVTVTASTQYFPNQPVVTTFRIAVTDVPVVNPPTGNSLALTAPTYSCQTGAITFNTTGGDGSLITYSAPGITRSSATSNTGTIEQGLRNDPKPITITATQSGQTITYAFDFSAYCAGTQPPVNPPTGDSLALLAPTYNCQSGAIHFNTSGGNGSPIEFKSIGITDWTVNPDQFVDKDSRTANDVKPFTLMARQNGQVVTYTWDLKAACGRARLSVAETRATLSLTVLGNPVRDQVRVRIEGAEGQSIRLRLTDVRGQLLETRMIEQAGASEEPAFQLDRSGPELLLLQAATNSEQKTVKIIKQ